MEPNVEHDRDRLELQQSVQCPACGREVAVRTRVAGDGLESFQRCSGCGWSRYSRRGTR